MTSSGTDNVRTGYSWIGILLFPFALLLLSAVPAHADDCVADLGGVIDGFVNPVLPRRSTSTATARSGIFRHPTR